MGWAVVSAVIAAAITTILAAQPPHDARLDEATARPDAVVAPAVAAVRSPRMAVTVDVTLAADAATLIAPAWTGTVTALHTGPGAVLRSGDPVVAVDAVVRTFAASPAPWWRPLTWGDSGPDVEGLTGFLVAAGRLGPVAEPGTFGPQHAAAVERLRADVGASPGTSFEPNLVIWAPADGFEVGGLNAVLGAAAPPSGTAVASGSRSVLGVTIRGDDGQPLDADSSSGTLVIGGQAAPADPAARSRFLAVLATDRADVGTSQVSIEAVLERGERADLWAIPVGAVLTGSDRRTCVIRADGEQVGVEVVDYEAGAVYVAGFDGGEVRINPAASEGRTTCH